MNPNLKAGPGRPKGSPNRAGREGREFAQRFVNDPEYRESLRRRVANDTLAPAVEVQLQHYAWGKPIDRVEISDTTEKKDLTALTDAELAAEAQSLAREALAVAKDPSSSQPN